MSTDDSDLQDLLGGALARIWPRFGGDPVGAGTLLAERKVLTCAHVVNAATGTAEAAQEVPDVDIEVDFPFSRDGRRFSARVTAWVPIDEAGGGDVCVLSLFQPLPSDCRPTELLESGRLTGHPFDVLGFPDGHPDGTEATGVLRGRNAAGWVQIQDPNTTGPRVRRGFSGAPVWDRTLRGVVGMVVTSSDDEREKTAFVIPTKALRDLLESAQRTPVDGAVSVAPPAVDLGQIGTATLAQARIRVRPGTDTTLEWTLAPSHAGFDVEAERGVLVVQPHAGGQGTEVATLTVTCGDGRCSVPLRVDMQGAPAGGSWPRPVDEDRVRDALRAFAEGSALVPDDLFAGDLELDYRPVVRARVTHVTEGRTVTTAESPEDPSHDLSYDGSLDILDVDLPAWESGSWEAVDGQSVVNVQCPDCDSEHRVFCRKCRGTAKVSCPRQVKCPDCRGLGWVTQDGLRQRCWTCSGSGRLRCPDCSGSGRQPCDACADGKVPCPRCGGDGWYHRYTKGEVRREARTVEKRTQWLEPKLDLKDEDFVALPVEGQSYLSSVPEEFRGELGDWLQSELEAWHPDEILRRLDLGVAPAVVVTYRRGRKQDKALVVGSRVRAPHAKRPGVWQIEHRVTARLENLGERESVKETRQRLEDRFRQITEKDTVQGARERIGGRVRELADADPVKGMGQRLRKRLQGRRHGAAEEGAATEGAAAEGDAEQEP